MFQFGRSEGFPSQYSAHHIPVTIDVTETILIAIFVIISIAYISIIPGYRKRQVSIKQNIMERFQFLNVSQIMLRKKFEISQTFSDVFIPTVLYHLMKERFLQKLFIKLMRINSNKPLSSIHITMRNYV